jgi:hypothetical protein
LVGGSSPPLSNEDNHVITDAAASAVRGGK